MSDLIDRQAAIDAFNTNFNELVVGGEENAKTVENYLNRVLDKIKCLPSALGTNLAEVGTDLISRQKAIDALTEYGNGRAVFISVGEAIIRIEQLPPIQPKLLQPWEVLVAQAVLPQPKRGKWILDRSGSYSCSECMEPCATYVMMKPRDKFCKMCGARMEVTE